MTGAEIEAALDGILDRRWYTNHGPMARRLEAATADAFAVAHAIAVTNPAIALVMMAEAQALSGPVLLSALAPPRCAQSLFWAGLRPRFCDIDPVTLGPKVATDPATAIGEASAFLATPGAPPDLAADLAASGLALYADGTPIPSGPRLVEIDCPGDDAGLACILTDDPDLAARLRNIRSSYGAGPPAPVVRTANGRVSEIQAAFALPHVPAARRPAVLAAGGFRILPWATGVILATGGDLHAVCAELGLSSRPVILPDAARACPAAQEVASRSLLLPARRVPDLLAARSPRQAA